MVLHVIQFFDPTCSDYQIWRGICGKELDLKYQGALYQAIDEMKLSRLVTARNHPDYPNHVYAITDAGRQWLAEHQEPDQASN